MAETINKIVILFFGTENEAKFQSVSSSDLFLVLWKSGKVLALILD